jgi:membrane-bound lytic murein transglycosylase D
MVAAPTPQPTVPQPAEPPAALVSPWDRLRARLAMPGCDYNPAVQRWARLYTQGPTHFAATLKRAAPFLLMVLDELEKQDLPGEFAFLPYLESTYEPLAETRGNNAAGMWQFVASTARGAGMVVTPQYDGRLDAWASTQGAVSLLARYQQEFGDWRLVDMAYNAGEFAVKQLLHGNDSASAARAAGRSAGADGVPNIAPQPSGTENNLSAEGLAKLKLSPITHEHLAKLLALSCILDEPARFRVELPEIGDDDRLQALELEAPIDLRVAQRLADVDGADFQRWNAAYRGTSMPSGAPQRLLLPSSARTRFLERYAQLAPEQWHDWSVVTLTAPQDVDALAAASGVDANLLGVINGVELDRAFTRGARVLLPARARANGVPLAPAPAISATAEAQSLAHVVRNGDTLWDIARHYRLSVQQLLDWNGLRANGNGLRIGQRLRLTAPE